MTGNLATAKSTKYCRHCSYQIEAGAKFCGECGASTESAINRAAMPQGSKHKAPAFAVPDTVSYAKLAQLEREKIGLRVVEGESSQNAGAVSTKAPLFALHEEHDEIPPELLDELRSLNTALLREQLFLIMHCCIFLISNLVGFAFSMKCYFDFHGDELSRMMMALTPLTFINLVAFACMAPIKGTRREIARIKERIKFVQVKIEYRNVI